MLPEQVAGLGTRETSLSSELAELNGGKLTPLLRTSSSRRDHDGAKIIGSETELELWLGGTTRTRPFLLLHLLRHTHAYAITKTASPIAVAAHAPFSIASAQEGIAAGGSTARGESADEFG